jgi:hypothetical protein
MRWRVVCTLEETMASFSPIKALSNVLLPALGLPNMLTNPDFILNGKFRAKKNKAYYGM